MFKNHRMKKTGVTEIVAPVFILFPIGVLICRYSSSSVRLSVIELIFFAVAFVMDNLAVLIDRLQVSIIGKRIIVVIGSKFNG